MKSVLIDKILQKRLAKRQNFAIGIEMTSLVDKIRQDVSFVKGNVKEQNVTKDVTKEVTKAKEAIVMQILADERVTIDELAVVLGVTRRQDLRYVKELTEDEVIRREGGRKLGKWVILKEYRIKDSE
ncbi:MAG: hypothetical protein UD961_15800 [Bacteroidales bacterium]|nr:hypothetical protein [Bacteroidales bacterium]